MKDVSTHSISEHEVIGLPIVHARSMRQLWQSIICPSFEKIEENIMTCLRSQSHISIFEAADLRCLIQEMTSGFMLTVQAMWERELRQMLVHRERLINHGNLTQDISQARWFSKDDLLKCKTSSKNPGLQQHFERLLGISLLSFDTYEDLDLLQNFGNAIRHGGGKSSQRIEKICFPGKSDTKNNLSPDEMSSGLRGAILPRQSTYKDVIQNRIVLEQMIRSIAWFWEDVEGIRLNSFKSKDLNVEKFINNWRKERLERNKNRLWSSHDNQFNYSPLSPFISK